MKVIGLIGGMSWNSTLEYYRLINEMVSQRLGGPHSARIVLYSLDFEEIERAQRESRWDDAASILAKAGTALKQAGTDFLLICTNTMHKVADTVGESAGIPVLHIVDATGNAIREQGLAKVGGCWGQDLSWRNISTGTDSKSTSISTYLCQQKMNEPLFTG